MQSAKIPTTILEQPIQGAFERDCAAIAARRPVIHAIPVLATADLVANALHAVGASPVMTVFSAEIRDIHARCQAVVLSMGTPDHERFKLLRTAVKSASHYGLPVVLDPVGVAASTRRLHCARQVVAAGKRLIIRGNVAEIEALAGVADQNDVAIDAGRDVEWKPLWENGGGALAVLQAHHAVLATGHIDCLWFGERGHLGRRGHVYQSKVTGMGCALSALCAAFFAVNSDQFEAALHALWLSNAAAELAASNAKGPGSFATAWLDALFRLAGNPKEAWPHTRA